MSLPAPACTAALRSARCPTVAAPERHLPGRVGCTRRDLAPVVAYSAAAAARSDRPARRGDAGGGRRVPGGSSDRRAALQRHELERLLLLAARRRCARLRRQPLRSCNPAETWNEYATISHGHVTGRPARPLGVPGSCSTPRHRRGWSRPWLARGMAMRLRRRAGHRLRTVLRSAPALRRPRRNACTWMCQPGIRPVLARRLLAAAGGCGARLRRRGVPPAPRLRLQPDWADPNRRHGTADRFLDPNDACRTGRRRLRRPVVLLPAHDPLLRAPDPESFLDLPWTPSCPHPLSDPRWAAALGQPAAIPWSLLAVNLLAVLLGTAATLDLLRHLAATAGWPWATLSAAGTPWSARDAGRADVAGAGRVPASGWP